MQCDARNIGGANGPTLARGVGGGTNTSLTNWGKTLRVNSQFPVLSRVCATFNHRTERIRLFLASLPPFPFCAAGLVYLTSARFSLKMLAECAKKLPPGSFTAESTTLPTSDVRSMSFHASSCSGNLLLCLPSCLRLTTIEGQGEFQGMGWNIFTFRSTPSESQYESQ